jgi:hypothetical protein
MVSTSTGLPCWRSRYIDEVKGDPAAAEISAGCSGADDQNAHICFLRCGSIAPTSMAAASADAANP